MHCQPVYIEIKKMGKKILFMVFSDLKLDSTGMTFRQHNHINHYSVSFGMDKHQCHTIHRGWVTVVNIPSNQQSFSLLTQNLECISILTTSQEMTEYVIPFCYGSLTATLTSRVKWEQWMVESLSDPTKAYRLGHLWARFVFAVW